MSDYISRQAAIDALKEIYEWHDNVTKERIIEHFERLPSAQPEPCDDAVSRKDATKELFMSMIIKSPEFGDMLTSEERSYNSGLREAAKIIKKLPSVTLKPQECKDTISRQAAIDIEHNATVDTNPSHFEAHQKFTQFMDDAEISSFGRWQWSNGFNTALTAVGIDLKKLPSAQPERKKGKWIVTSEFTDCHYAKCNQCKVTQVFYYNKPLTNFCPNCGADMRGEQDG